MTRRFSSVRCRACGLTLVSTHRHDFQQCGCPQDTFVDGGAAYLRIGGRDLQLVEALVDPEWPTGVSLGLLRQAHRLARELRCGFDPPKTATDDHVNHVIDWMTASLELAGDVDNRLRDPLIDAGLWPPAPENLGPLPPMIRAHPPLSGRLG
jgi:hypothetical protein